MSSRYISEILHPKIDHSQHNYLFKLVKKLLFWAVFIIHAVSLSTVLRLFQFGWAHSWYNKTIYMAESIACDWAGVVMQKLLGKRQKKIRYWPTNQRTDQRTDQWTNQRTDTVKILQDHTCTMLLIKEINISFHAETLLWIVLHVCSEKQITCHDFFPVII